MSTASKRQKSRRRLAAYSFLSNISLDGTHRDTKIGIYNLSLQTEFVKSSENAINSDTPTTRRNVIHLEPQNDRELLSTRIAVSEEKLQIAAQQSGSSPRLRVHSFASETKSKFLSSKKKTGLPVFEQRTQVYCRSAESLGLCRQVSSSASDTSYVNYEVRFCKSLRNVHEERIILLSPSKAPFIIFSCLPYVKQSTYRLETNRRRQASGNRPLSAINDESDPLNLLAALGYQVHDGQEVSYNCLLSSTPTNAQHRRKMQDVHHLVVPCPHISRCHSFDPTVSNVHSYIKQPTTPPSNYERAFEWTDPRFCHHTCFITYTPNLLDDPELVTGKHSTVLTFPSYVSSIIDYVKPSDLKKELNEKFREKFPHIQLTLSKLRSLKREMLKITHVECGIDLVTVAQAYVFFEKLILKLLINKQNRKPCAAACLLLSAKLNDIKGNDLKIFIEKLESGFRLNHKDLINCEFGVLVALEFSLHLPTWEIFPHYQRLLYES